MMQRILIWIFLVTVVSCVSNQKVNYAKNDLWSFVTIKEIDTQATLPTKFLMLKLNESSLQERFAKSDFPELSLPSTEQSFINVRIEDSGTMSPELAKKFPNIKSYRGEGVETPSIKVRIDKNTFGLYAMITNDSQTYFINPIEKGSSTYIVYDKVHAVRGGNPFADQVIK